MQLIFLIPQYVLENCLSKQFNGVFMASPIYFPSLSESSWITSSVQKADYLFSHFYESNYSQTELYKDRVSSMAYLVAQYNADPSRLSSELQRVLESYFGKYFSTVVCDVQWQTNATDESVIELTLYLAFTDDEGKEFNLSKLIGTSGGKIISVLNSNNYGTTS